MKRPQLCDATANADSFAIRITLGEWRACARFAADEVRQDRDGRLQARHLRSTDLANGDDSEIYGYLCEELTAGEGDCSGDCSEGICTFDDEQGCQCKTPCGDTLGPLPATAAVAKGGTAATPDPVRRGSSVHRAARFSSSAYRFPDFYVSGEVVEAPPDPVLRPGNVGSRGMLGQGSLRPREWVMLFAVASTNVCREYGRKERDEAQYVFY